MKTGTVQWIVGGILLLAVLASIVTLAIKGDVTGEEALGVIGTIVAGALAILGVHVGSTSATNASSAALGATRTSTLLAEPITAVLSTTESPTK